MANTKSNEKKLEINEEIGKEMPLEKYESIEKQISSI